AEGIQFNQDLSTIRNNARENSEALVKNEVNLVRAINRREETSPYFANRSKFRTKEREKYLEWIRSNPDRDLAAYLLVLQNLDTIGKYYNRLSPDVRNGVFKATLDSEYERYLKFTAVRKAQRAVDSGYRAPQFTLPHENGSEFTLFDDFEGKYIVLDFWGSWCAPCIQGIPKMKEYYDKYSSEMEIIGIACNDQDENWRNAIEKYNLNWTHLKNNDDAVEADVSVRYGVSAFPTKVIIDPDGIIRGYFAGEGDDFYAGLDNIME
ncbi:MAG: TlpA disulfide reductase family protein, partial [Cyclobacteriaceae bacterium]